MVWPWCVGVRPSLYLLGITGNLAIAGLWLVTRTVGIPLFGPHAGEVEEVGAVGVSATVVGLALVVALAVLWLLGHRPNTLASIRETGMVRAGGLEFGVSRRDFLRAAGAVGALEVSGSVLGTRVARGQGTEPGSGGDQMSGMAGHGGNAVGGNGTVGDVDLSRFDPTGFLRDFYWGEEKREGGRVVREYELIAEAVEIEVAPGVMYPAWAYNGQVPGPTLRAREGDRLRVVFKNKDTHPHTIHFHGFHPANMDGVFELVGPGQEYVYEFDAEPFGATSTTAT